jgi:lipopolysaccharide heptosyltransferase I
MESLADRVGRLEPQRICIIKPSSLGDVVHSLPILPALRILFPKSEVTWVVNSSFRELLDGHPDLDQVIALDRGDPGISSSAVAGIARVCRRLLREKFDLTIDLQGLLRSGLMTAATRATVRVGMADAREGSRWFYTHHVEAPRRGMHAVDRVLRVVAALGLEECEPSFEICLSEQDRIWAREFLEDVPRPRLILNLGGRWMTKRWPPEHFAEIARRAASEFGAGLIAVGAEEDRPLARALQSAIAPLPLLDLSGHTTLLQLAALARQSDLYLSNDSGPLHLAAAAGASVLGVYTCTDPRLTGPYGPRTATVQSCVWCAPSFRKTCDRLDCVVELGPERVWPLVRHRLRNALESPGRRSLRKASALLGCLPACPDFAGSGA